MTLVDRWLFYIEGSLTIAVAFLAIFILPDFPSNTRWLSPLERRLAMQRMAEDGGIQFDDETETDTVPIATEKNAELVERLRHKLNRLTRHGHGLWLAASDGKVWWLTIAFTAEVTALSFNAFFPTLTKTLGFNTTVSLHADR